MDRCLHTQYIYFVRGGPPFLPFLPRSSGPLVDRSLLRESSPLTSTSTFTFSTRSGGTERHIPINLGGLSRTVLVHPTWVFRIMSKRTCPWVRRSEGGLDHPCGRSEEEWACRAGDGLDGTGVCDRVGGHGCGCRRRRRRGRCWR
jgi:hypothetical protein